MTGKDTKKTAKIIAYGFQKAGFELPESDMCKSKRYDISFVRFRDETSLDDADGVIMLQGIFESIKDTSHFQVSTEVTFDEAQLSERQRQIYNLMMEGKWVCFLVRRIIDSVPQHHGRQKIISTDLCKRILNNLGVERTEVNIHLLHTYRDEFNKYVRNYGVARTSFAMGFGSSKGGNILIEGGDFIVGLEFYRKIFFLPFHTTRYDANSTSTLVQTVADAILDYRLKTVLSVPTWLSEFRFATEKVIESSINKIDRERTKLSSELANWQEYKAILTSSGELLKSVIVKIFKEFFGIDVDPIDKGREDFRILNNEGKPIILVETKGTKKGVKREHINQVDSYRERNDLPAEFPGVLIINNEMALEGIDNRLRTTIAKEQIEHAVKHNVLILRTIDLLFVMKMLEESDDRHGKMLEILLKKTGWLKATVEGYEIIK